MYPSSINTASSHGSCSDEEDVILRVVAPQAKRAMFGAGTVPVEAPSLGFSEISYLNDALKFDAYNQQRDVSLDELVEIYNNSSSFSVNHRGPLHPSVAPKVDSIGENDELEFIDEQPRYTREEKGKSAELSDSEQGSSSTPPISSVESSLFGEAPPLPTTGLTRDDIIFRIASINVDPPSPVTVQSELAKVFPSLVEPPARMFGENGAPLPPTKKEEISAAERAARQDALKVEIKGSKVHSLVKAVIVLESRTSLWKKMANVEKNASDSASLALLPDLPNPWDMEITHEGLDISAFKNKTRKIFQLPASRIAGACRKCSGSGSENCRTCRGEVGSECFWCSGSGMQKGRRRCGRCQGQGRLSCMACEGKMASACRSCDGAGCGEYCAFVEVKMRRIEVPAVSVADLLGRSRASAANARPETVRAASIDMLWELVKLLANKASARTKRPYLPVSAVCTWEKSISYLAQVTAIQNAKFKAGSKQPFRPEGMQRTVPTKIRYFSLPTDPSLPLAELTKNQFVQQNIPEKAVIEVGSSHGVLNVSRRLSTMLFGEVSYPSTPQLSSGGSSPKQADYFGDNAGAVGTVDSVPVTPFSCSPISSPPTRPCSIRPMSPKCAPPAQFNPEELRIKMLRHSSSFSRANFSRPLKAPGVPI